MSIPIKFLCWMLPLCLLLSCSDKVEEDYLAIASSISNGILIEIFDSEGNNLIVSEEKAKGVSLIQTDGYKVPFNIVNVNGNAVIKAKFPLPPKTSMSYSDDKLSGYGESELILKFNDTEYLLKGFFHYICSDPEIFGGDGIKLIEVKYNDKIVSIDNNLADLVVSLEYPASH